MIGKATLRATGAVLNLKPFERAVLNRVGSENSVLDSRRFLERELAAIDHKLRDLGLLVSRETEKPPTTGRSALR